MCSCKLVRLSEAAVVCCLMPGALLLHLGCSCRPFDRAAASVLIWQGEVLQPSAGVQAASQAHKEA